MYRRRWPVLDHSLDIRDLAAEALPDLRYAIAAAGAVQAGPPRWELAAEDGDLVLTAVVPCSLSRSLARTIDDENIGHLIRDGVTPARIAAMLRIPVEEVELAALRVQHRVNRDMELVRELAREDSLEEDGLSNSDRMWRSAS
jgi:hypothetical protein